MRSRFGFTWQMFKVQPSAPEVTNDSGLYSEVNSLGHTLFGEIAKAATETWYKSFVGKSEVTRKALSPLRTMHRKLTGLSFVEPRVIPVVDLLETAFTMVGKKGHVNGTMLIMLQGLVSLLRDPDGLLAHAQSILDGSHPDAILNGFSGLTLDPSPDQEESTQDQEETLDDEGLLMAPLPVGPQLDSLGLW